jgi:hypothetical protein
MTNIRQSRPGSERIERNGTRFGRAPKGPGLSRRERGETLKLPRPKREAVGCRPG